MFQCCLTASLPCSVALAGFLTRATAVPSPLLPLFSATSCVSNALHVQAVERDPASFLQEAVMSRASTEAEAAYAEAQSRARDVALLVRCVGAAASVPPWGLFTSEQPRLACQFPCITTTYAAATSPCCFMSLQIAERGCGNDERLGSAGAGTGRDAGLH